MKYFLCLFLLTDTFRLAAASRGSSWGHLLHGASAGTIGTRPVHEHKEGASFVAVEPSTDYNEQTEVRLPEEVAPAGYRTMPMTIEAFVATLWCLMIGSVPIVLAINTHTEVTRVQIIEGVLLIAWLVGGIAAFTQTIIFQSAHFDGQRSLTMVESTYLLTQILTTIGYGDITPALPRGQVVVGIYILFSVILVGNMFSQAAHMVEKRVAEYRNSSHAHLELPDETDAEVHRRMGKVEAVLLKESADLESPKTFGWVPMPTVDNAPVARAFLSYITVASIGIVFFRFYPGEGKTWLQAIYMSIVTLSTVGFGAFTAITEVGKAFSSFWMLFGVAALGNLVTKCVEWSLCRKEYEAYCPQKEDASWNEEIKSMDRNGDGEVDALEFMKFALVHAGYTTEEKVERVAHFFRRMHPDADGKVPLKRFQELATRTG